MEDFHLQPISRFLLLAALVLIPTIANSAWDEDALPGWMGEMETKRPDSVGHEHAGGKSLLRGPDPIVVDPTKVVQLSWKPRAFLYKGFLSDKECDHLINLAKDKLTRSEVVDTIDPKKGALNEIRTSSGMFLNNAQDDIVKGIEDRIAAWTFLPPENGESIQVLRYNLNQKYDAHFDYFHDKENLKVGGHRIATVLMYLSDVIRGGETVFPDSAEKGIKDDSWSECGKRGIGVKPKKGDALLFFSLKPDATTDEYSLHAGCPVLEGEKWSATKWIHVSEFEARPKDPNKCENDDPRCGEWAAAGECEKNKPFMIGEGGFIGNCRRACNACKHLAHT